MATSYDTSDPETHFDGEGNLKVSSVDSVPAEFGVHALNNKLTYAVAGAHRTSLRLIVYRIRPGPRFTENSIWIAATMILYCFEIKTARNGNDVGVEPLSCSTTLQGPRVRDRSFNCFREPRLKAVNASLYGKAVHDERTRPAES